MPSAEEVTEYQFRALSLAVQVAPESVEVKILSFDWQATRLDGWRLTWWDSPTQRESTRESRPRNRTAALTGGCVTGVGGGT